MLRREPVDIKNAMTNLENKFKLFSWRHFSDEGELRACNARHNGKQSSFTVSKNFKEVFCKKINDSYDTSFLFFTLWFTFSRYQCPTGSTYREVGNP